MCAINDKKSFQIFLTSLQRAPIEVETRLLLATFKNIVASQSKLKPRGRKTQLECVKFRIF